MTPTIATSLPTDATGITFHPARQPARPFDTSLDVKTSKQILQAARGARSPPLDEILQSSLSQPANKPDGLRIPKKNGFVHTVLEAYNQHRALIIRPDDVWIAILTQFSLFVNANAEDLRDLFVAHEGKKKLVVTAAGNRYSVDFGGLAQRMTRLIHENVVDPSLQTWIMPNFSTTTFTDTTVSAIAMMGTLKAYFSYGFVLMCGIPQVTLKGTKADWESILGRLEKLKDYGIETCAWFHLLRPVLKRFAAAFDNPSSESNFEFWNNVCHTQSLGSGDPILSGWITAFCAFNKDGKFQGHRFKTEPNTTREQITEAAQLSATEFWQKYFIDIDDAQKHGRGSWTGREPLHLDNTLYGTIKIPNIPPATVEVDIELNDNGLEIPSVMTAGLVAMSITSSGNKELSGTGENDTVSPVPGWWMWTKGGEKES